MGIDNNALRFLLQAKANRVSFNSTLTIGRQQYHDLTSADFHTALQNGGLPMPQADSESLFTQDEKFTEPLFRLLGATEIESLDYSSYENATIVHDMNQPVPEQLHNRFSCVFDSGTLEHIFHFPQAIQNCMEMVSPGGHLLAVTPANNFMGHGFYQFSPELFYRVLSPQNGFEVEEMLLSETGSPWRELADPERIGRRLEMITSNPAFLLIRARKIKQTEIFRTPPQQSDYASAWTETRPWSERAGQALDEILKHTPPGANFILLDGYELGVPDDFQGRKRIPFLEQNGEYWGDPANDSIAIPEFLRIQASNPQFLIFAWPAYWWFDCYPEFHNFLRANYKCLAENDRVVIFNLLSLINTPYAR